MNEVVDEFDQFENEIEENKKESNFKGHPTLISFFRIDGNE